MLIKIGKHQLISLLNYLGASLCFQQNDQNPSNVAKSRSTFFLSNQSLLSVSLCTKGFFPSPSGLSQIPFTLLGKFPHLHVLCLLRHSESQPKLLSPTRFTSSSQTKSGAQKAGESHSVFSESLRLHGQSMEFSRLENWSEQPFPSPGGLPNPGIEPHQKNKWRAKPQKHSTIFHHHPIWQTLLLSGRYLKGSLGLYYFVTYFYVTQTNCLFPEKVHFVLKVGF